LWLLHFGPTALTRVAPSYGFQSLLQAEVHVTVVLEPSLNRRAKAAARQRTLHAPGGA
jgi:hypothetical protein